MALDSLDELFRILLDLTLMRLSNIKLITHIATRLLVSNIETY